MLIFNGKSYARNDKEFTESLFKPFNGQTCNGYYRKMADGIKLMRQDKTLEAFIVNRSGEKFVVSASDHNGKTRYMYGCPKQQSKLMARTSLIVANFSYQSFLQIQPRNNEGMRRP